MALWHAKMKWLPARRAPSDTPEQAAALIAASGLFDAAFYLSREQDVRDAGLDPLDHFCRYGWREGRWPNLYFDPAFHGAIAGGAMNPLVHYILRGEAAGHAPSAAFDPSWYRRVADVPAGVSPLAHLLAHRRAQGLAPEAPSDLAFYADRGPIDGSGLFDLNFYLIDNPDVGQAGLDPIFHFHAYGWREGRRPNLYFDPVWYDVVYLAPDGCRDNPLAHYIRLGEAAGLQPSCLFDPAWYRATYKVPKRRLALAHFLENRRRQTVAPNRHFDLAFYLARHGAEIGPNRDPFAHLLRWGASRDLDPSAAFVSATYRQTMETDEPHARSAPFVHFLDASARAAARQRSGPDAGR